MSALKLSSDRKVSPKSKLNSNRWTPEIKNAFGLPAHISCPGATAICHDTCYAFKLERAYTNVTNLLHHNYDTLWNHRTSVTEMSILLHDMMLEFDAGHDKVEQKYNRTFPRIFRIHWDGDFFSVRYAQAWARVINSMPHIQFWAYTRSFTSRINVVPHLANLDNLTLYLSVDSVNRNRAAKIIEEHPWAKVAYLGSDWKDAVDSVQIVINKKAPKCPENTGKYDLVTENQQGACVECMLCVNGTNNILFAIDKR